jgi:hypothetical protein
MDVGGGAGTFGAAIGGVAEPSETRAALLATVLTPGEVAVKVCCRIEVSLNWVIYVIKM